MKNLLCICCLLCMWNTHLQAQIGINTTSPSATLEVWDDANGRNYTILRASDNSYRELLGVDKEGYVRLDGSSPSVLMDLRGSTGAIGIGYTNTDASEVGAGAIRYNTSLQTLEYSDGVEWVRLQANPQKAFVIANNSSGQITDLIDDGSGIGEVIASGSIKNWTIIYDQSNDFDPVTGWFTVPRDGIYSVSATAVFNSTEVIIAGYQYELNITTIEDGALLKNVVPLLTTGMVNLTNVSKGLFYLTAGMRLYMSFYIKGVDAPQVLSPDGSLNMLTIAEM